MELKVYTGHGIRNTENNHRDKLRDCEKFFGWKEGIEEPYRGHSLLVLDNGVASELAKTQCM